MKSLNEQKIIKLITFIIFVIIIFFVLKNNSILLEKFDKVNISEKNIMEVTKKDIKIKTTKNIHMLISPQEYKNKLESSEYVHIDIRTKQEYEQEKIFEGLNIDFYSVNFKEELDRLDKNKKYIYHCRSGSRSKTAIKIFEKLGFKEIYELEGGINNWKKFYQTIK